MPDRLVRMSRARLCDQSRQGGQVGPSRETQQRSENQRSPTRRRPIRRPGRPQAPFATVKVVVSHLERTRCARAYESAGGLRSDACPHPALAEFVLNAWSRKTGLAARVYRWSSDDAEGRESLTLALGSENRWCAHVQRPHRSNGTLLRVDLRHYAFAQFYFDADCRADGFRGSDWLPIPPELCDAALPNTSERDMVGTGAVNATCPWLVSEAALAALPLDDIVAAHTARLTQHSHVASDGASPSQMGSEPCWPCQEASNNATDNVWLSDDVLAAMPLPAQTDAD